MCVRAKNSKEKTDFALIYLPMRVSLGCLGLLNEGISLTYSMTNPLRSCEKEYTKNQWGRREIRIFWISRLPHWHFVYSFSQDLRGFVVEYVTQWKIILVPPEAAMYWRFRGPWSMSAYQLSCTGVLEAVAALSVIGTSGDFFRRFVIVLKKRSDKLHGFNKKFF